MRVGILGTRGIPNAYGGFEQFAEYLSVYLVKQGHEVFVYNSHLHPYQEPIWNGVQLIHCKDWEDRIGTAGQFIYDLNCIRDARKRSYDVLLQLGYTSSSVWARLLPGNAKIMTNMDGMEWKRSKFSGAVQHFLRKAERWAVKSSDIIVADSLAIKDYLDEKYSIQSIFIAYGAPVAPARSVALLSDFGLVTGEYNMLVARMEPENNIEMILEGQEQSDSKIPFVVVGDSTNSFSNHLRVRFGGVDSIRFMGGVFDLEKLDCLRQQSRLYFHGHSVGGTNPSLLEAMGCGADIVAHDNAFNKTILGNDAQYFSSAVEVAQVLSADKTDVSSDLRIQNNLTKIKEVYSWHKINRQYEESMQDLIS